MKKYRLIEYCTSSCGTPKLEVGSFETLSMAQDSMMSEQKNSKNYYYRIEEIEESIMDRVKSYEDACEVLDVLPIRNTVGDSVCVANNGLLVLGADYSKHIIALLKLETITAALNEGWKPDWENIEQRKYFVTMRANETTDVCYYVQFYSGCPSRLYFKSRELAEYAAKQFAELYKQLLIEKF